MDISIHSLQVTFEHVYGTGHLTSKVFINTSFKVEWMSINYFKILQPGGGGFSKSYRTKSCGLLFFTPAAFSVDLFDFELLLLLLMENSSKASKAKPAAEIRCWIEAKSWRVVEVVDVVVVVVVDVVLSSSSSTWCCHRRCRCCYWCIKNHFQIAKDDFSFRSIFNFPSPKKKKL